MLETVRVNDEAIGHVYRVARLFWVWELYASRPELFTSGATLTRLGAIRTVRRLGKGGRND